MTYALHYFQLEIVHQITLACVRVPLCVQEGGPNGNDDMLGHESEGGFDTAMSDAHVTLPLELVPNAEPNNTVDQILPMPALGDCGPLAIITGLLCPMTHDEIEFNARLQRFFALPLPSGVALNVPPPVFVSRAAEVFDEVSFRSFLHLFHTSRLEVTASNALWLKYGPDPVGEVPDMFPQSRYAAAVRYCRELVQYLRNVLVAYRSTRVDMDVSSAEATAAGSRFA
jgi:hypothetical protein